MPWLLPNHRTGTGTRLSGSETECYRLRLTKAVRGNPPMIRPRRSLLFMPGSNARALEKAPSLPVDGLILDLEDAVAPDAKALARDQIAQAVAARGFGMRELTIRINGMGSPWHEDDLA